MDILDKINIYIDEDRMAGMTSAGKKSYERKKYRLTKNKKKSSLKKLRRSAEGDKRDKRKKRQPNRTPMGKGERKYHV